MEEEELKRKKVVRKAQRAVLTKTMDRCMQYWEDELVVDRLKHKKSILIEKRDLLRSLDKAILEATADDELVKLRE